MFIEIRQHGGFCVVRCEGSFVPGLEMEYLQAKLDEIGKRACTTLLVDFQGVTSIGSIGVTFIVVAYTSVVRQPGGRFLLTGVNPRVRRVLDLTRISAVVPLASDLASGLEIWAAEGSTGDLVADFRSWYRPPPEIGFTIAPRAAKANEDAVEPVWGQRFGAAAELPLGPELYVTAGRAGDLVAGDPATASSTE
jgi:anti-anti-sigma factor